MSVEGGCLCGAIRYRVSGEPLARSLCHCRSCRLGAGAPSVAEREIWTAEKLPWERLNESLRQYPGSSRT